MISYLVFKAKGEVICWLTTTHRIHRQMSSAVIYFYQRLTQSDYYLQNETLKSERNLWTEMINITPLYI